MLQGVREKSKGTRTQDQAEQIITTLSVVCVKHYTTVVEELCHTLPACSFETRSKSLMEAALEGSAEAIEEELLVKIIRLDTCDMHRENTLGVKVECHFIKQLLWRRQSKSSISGHVKTNEFGEEDLFITEEECYYHEEHKDNVYRFQASGFNDPPKPPPSSVN